MDRLAHAAEPSWQRQCVDGSTRSSDPRLRSAKPVRLDSPLQHDTAQTGSRSMSSGVSGLAGCDI